MEVRRNYTIKAFLQMSHTEQNPWNKNLHMTNDKKNMRGTFCCPDTLMLYNHYNQPPLTIEIILILPKSRAVGSDDSRTHSVQWCKQQHGRHNGKITVTPMQMIYWQDDTDKQCFFLRWGASTPTSPPPIRKNQSTWLHSPKYAFKRTFWKCQRKYLMNW
jgi:hypothetical protein